MRDRKESDQDGREVRNSGIVNRKTVIKIYYMIQTNFSIKEKNKKELMPGSSVNLANLVVGDIVAHKGKYAAATFMEQYNFWLSSKCLSLHSQVSV